MKEKKILYITFTNLSATASTGSELRPQKMLAALRESAAEVRYVTGVQNDFKSRMEAYRTAMGWLKEWRPDLCYIEPPSGPLFFSCDRQLIRTLHALHVPIGLFYRDAYWRFPELIGDAAEQKSIKAALKAKVIYLMQRRDWRLYLKNCKRIYFPTALMASYFDCKQAGVLPPGCTSHIDGPTPHNTIPSAVYVGGATERYGMPLLLSAGQLVNQHTLKLKINVVCQEPAWNAFLETHPQYNCPMPWLEVHHLNAGARLEQLYGECDFAVIPLVKNTYHDFAFPVKLAEYLSHLLPIVSTDCVETQAFIDENKIGLVAEAAPGPFAAALARMAEDETLRSSFRMQAVRARADNLWTKRADKVIHDLTGDECSE